MKWHWNVEVKRIIIADRRHEEHHDQNRVIFQSNLRLDGAEFRGKDEAMKSNEEELKESY